MISPIDTHEASDTYSAELFRQGRLRVIICKHQLQWIVQRKKAGSGARWKAVGYCRTQKAVKRVWTEHGGAYAPEIDALPERFGGGAS